MKVSEMLRRQAAPIGRGTPDATAFAKLISNWKNVRYDRKKGRGTAELSDIRIVWEQAPGGGIWVSIQGVGTQRAKTAQQLQKSLEEINKLLAHL